MAAKNCHKINNLLNESKNDTTKIMKKVGRGQF